MSADFLHGIETIEASTGASTITTVKTAVVALIGVAPIGDRNKLILSNSARDDAQFGKTVPGFNIPKTLQIIRAIAGSAPILVVNVFDSSSHTSIVTAEQVTVTNGGFKLANAPIGDIELLDDGGDATEFVKGVDYSIDEFGNFKVLSSAIADGAIFKVNYEKLDLSAVTDAEIIGGVDGTGNRTGLSLFEYAQNQYGFSPKIICAPVLIERTAVSAAVATLAPKVRAIYLQDAPQSTTVSAAIAGRGPAGAINFNTANGRAYLLYPYGVTYDDYAGANAAYPYSAFMAGLMIKNDNENGFWASPSNKIIDLLTGVDKSVSWGLNDAGSDANLLNAAGITTIAQGYGTGFRAWGNRTDLFPGDGSAKSFLTMRRIDDIVSESMEIAALPFIDQPITQALIDSIKASGNGYINTLIARGALMPGSKIVWSKDDNPDEELAAGHITFKRIYMGPTPAERITFESVMDISLLGSLK